MSEYYSSYFCKIHPESKFNSEWCINFDREIVFITVNKCAGTTLRNTLPQYGFHVVDNNIIDEEKIKSIKHFSFYSIIRDPVKRYISGLDEFIFYYNKVDEISLIEKNLEENKFIFDEHTLPQFKSFEKLHELKYTLFAFESNLSDIISQVLEKKIELNFFNTTKEKPKKYTELQLGESLYTKYCKNNLLFDECYKIDFDLHKNIINP
jgi:hypothetical protein